MPELGEDLGKRPFMAPWTARQEFAQKSEKSLCSAALSAKPGLVMRSEKLETASVLGEEESVKAATTS